MTFLQNASTIFFHTSNVLKWKSIQLFKNQVDEPATCIQTVLKCWHDKKLDEDQTKSTDIIVACDKHRDKIPESERSDIRVTAKLFLFKNDPEAVAEAVNRTLDRLSISDIETLLISLTPEMSNGMMVDHPPCMGLPWAKVHQSTAQSLLKIWPILEKLVTSNRVFRIGVCDMPVEQMQLLCDSVEISPKVNQVFLGSACLLCEDLENFSKAHDIQLSTHQDPAEILSKQTFQDIISQEFSSEDAAGWEPKWLIRYSEVYQHRGVVRSKGYTMMAERNV